MRYLVFSPEIFFHYDLYRAEHFTHHAHMATAKDKNLFLLTGTPFQGFFKSIIYPEWRLVDIVQETRNPDNLQQLLFHWLIKLVFTGTVKCVFLEQRFG